jgi:hypothetical protein
MKLILLTCALLLAGCPGGGGAGHGSSAGTAIIQLRCDVPDANIWIDDRAVGQVQEASGGIRIKAGFHRLELRHDRYHTRYFELSLSRGETRTLEVELVEILD